MHENPEFALPPIDFAQTDKNFSKNPQETSAYGGTASAIKMEYTSLLNTGGASSA